MPLLEVRGLEKYYGSRKVVDGVDFEVDAGEVVGLLGPNGAGKTTSFRMTTGQVTPNGGRVVFNGQDVTKLPMYLRARLGMGYLPQEHSVFRKLSVEQNILAILEAMPALRSLGRKLNKQERLERTDDVLEQFGLNKVRKNNSMRISGGEKRRLEIARCLVCEPLLILLDEPFTGIDPITIADIQGIVRDLRNRGIGILMTDHNVRAALKITDRSYLIKDGSVRTQGTPQQLVSDPIAIRDYLGNSFNDDGVVGPVDMPMDRPTLKQAPAPMSRPPVKPLEQPVADVHQVIELERIRRLVESLKSADHDAVVSELRQRGVAAVPALIEALERKDVELRQQAFNVLQQVINCGSQFDPFAPESQRRQQIIRLREQFERKAG